MTSRSSFLLALLLPCCTAPAPYVCLAPVNLNFSEPLASYDFGITGRIEDGSEYGRSASCPIAFSGGDCDENGISLRNLDNLEIVLDLSVFVSGQAVFEGQLVIDDIAAASCESGGTREADVVF